MPESDALERRVLDAVRRHAMEGRLPASAWTVGLGRAEFEALIVALGVADPGSVLAADGPARSPFLSPLIAMLWSMRSGDGPWTRLMSGTIASAAFGERHLWQDLGAAGRPEVTALLRRHFPAVVSSNVRDLKWKHHLFRLLGGELGLPELRPPRCGGCEDQPLCFPDTVGVTVQGKVGDGATAHGRTEARGPG